MKVRKPAPLWKRVSLLLLFSRDGLTAREIAEKIGRTPNCASSHLQIYAAKGLVKRVPGTKPIVWRHEFFA